MIALLQSLPDAVATGRMRLDVWTPAQIGWHVAATNEWLAATISGARDVSEPAPEGFVEDWSRVAIPAVLTSPPHLEPPLDPSGADAVDRLQASRAAVVHALYELSPERATECVTSHLGTLSLYQVGELVTRHVERHVGQVQRTVVALMAAR